jgi:hypothetical protein
MIAIITHRQAVEVDRVLSALRHLGEDPIRLNTGSAESEVFIAINPPVLSNEARCDGKRVSAGEIGCAWAHQLPPLSADRTHSSLAEVAAESSRMQMWNAFMSLIPDGRWLTPPAKLYEAGNKVRQMLGAAAAGISVPQSAVGNSASAVRALSGPIIAKYLGDSGSLWMSGPNGHASVTISLTPEEIDPNVIRRSPAIFQTEVPSYLEVRVVAIRSLDWKLTTTFAAGAVKPPGFVDLRLSNSGRPEYAPHLLPTDMVNRLTTLMEAMKVGFCSADFILTPDGEYFFLDLNSTGAWWWIDDIYEGAVATEIALLLRGINSTNRAYWTVDVGVNTQKQMKGKCPILREDGTWLVTDPAHIRDVALRWSEFSNDVRTDRNPEFDFLLTSDPPSHTHERAIFDKCFGALLASDITELVRPKFRNLLKILLESTNEGEDLASDVIEPLCREVLLVLVPEFAIDLIAVGSLERAVDDRCRLLLADAAVRSHQVGVAGLASNLLAEWGFEVAFGKLRGMLTAIVISTTSTLPAMLTMVAAQELSWNANSTPVVPEHRTPLLGLYRRTVLPAVIGDQNIAEGDMVFLAWDQASRTTRRDLLPSAIAFGSGCHFCPASRLALSMATIIRAELRAFNAVTLHPDWRPTYVVQSHFAKLHNLLVNGSRSDS